MSLFSSDYDDSKKNQISEMSEMSEMSKMSKIQEINNNNNNQKYDLDLLIEYGFYAVILGIGLMTFGYTYDYYGNKTRFE